MTPMEKIDEREKGIAKWLDENIPDSGTDKYLDEGSEARFYWHAGYRSAMADVRKLLANG